MVQTIIDDSEILTVIKKRVGGNGQISIGTEFAGMQVTVYVVKSERQQ